MAYFVLEDIDYDQSGGGLPYAIPELQRQLPVKAKVARQMSGPDRNDYFFGILERPLTYHPAAEFDWARAQTEFIGTDDAGQFVSIYAIVICSLFVGTQVYAGMKGFPVRVALVVDNTLGRDETLAFDKCDYAAQGFISDVPEAPSSATHTGSLTDGVPND